MKQKITLMLDFDSYTFINFHFQVQDVKKGTQSIQLFV